MEKVKRLSKVCFAMMLVFSMSVLTLTGCGDKEEPTTKLDEKKQESKLKSYEEKEFTTLTDDAFFEGDRLLVDRIYKDTEGRPAIYKYCPALDDDSEASAYIQRYSLTEEGNFEDDTFGIEYLSKFRKKYGGEYFTMPFITRGDDGNLYGLMRIGGTAEDDMMGGLKKGSYGRLQEDENVQYKYVVIDLNEESKDLVCVELQTDCETEGVTAKMFNSVTEFHVFEDGTYMLSTKDGLSAFFDVDTGFMNNAVVPVVDSATSKKVGYGEQNLLYYSNKEGIFKVLDKESLEVVSKVGENIDESERKYEWHFDSSNDNGAVYALSASGLYSLSDSGQKFSLDKACEGKAFESLKGETIYDFTMDSDGGIYVLMRKEVGEDGESTDEQEEATEDSGPSWSNPNTDEYEFGIQYFAPKK